jgi:hypothetical protein
VAHFGIKKSGGVFLDKLHQRQNQMLGLAAAGADKNFIAPPKSDGISYFGDKFIGYCAFSFPKLSCFVAPPVF